MNRSLRWPSGNIFLIILLMLWLPPFSARAQSVTCTATMATANFGTVDLVAGTGLSTSTTLNYTCTNSSASARLARACFSIGDGSQGFTPATLIRQLGSGVPQKLQFQLYWPDNSTVWGSSGFGSLTPYQTAVLTVPARKSISGSVTMQARILPGQTAPPPSSYSDDFNGVHTAIAHSESATNGTPAGCTGITDAGTFGFLAQAVVAKSCTVTAGAASDIQIGAAGGVEFNAGSSSGSSNISVTCSNTTPYFIGLAPSNNNAAGAGLMSGTGANTDKVPYQLRSVSVAGPVWGNTATSTSVGNGLTGTGSGVANTIPVFAIAPSANFMPDNYSDTVTVNVNY